MKKDINFLPKLEKAIQDKYGSNAIRNYKDLPEDFKNSLAAEIQDFEYKIEQKKMQKPSKHFDGFFIIGSLIKENNSERVCKVCDSFSFDISDEIYFHRFDCYQKCYIQFVEDREERWMSGWRPNKEKNIHES